MAGRVCRIWPQGRSKVVDLLSVLFGLGAWLGINAIYTQMPLLVETAPEGWQLPSIVVIVVQVSNVGVIAVWIFKAAYGDSLSVSKSIYTLMSIGCLSMLLLSFFYGYVVFIKGNYISVPLIILLCLISLGCCVSSVLYFPYMARFHEKYLVPYMVGEGLGGFVPAIISFGQDIGSNQSCEGNEGGSSEPLFGVGTFLQITFAFMVVSLIAFALLDNLGAVLKGRTLNAHHAIFHGAVQDSVNPERTLTRTSRLQDEEAVGKTNKTEGAGENTGLASGSSDGKSAPGYGVLTPKATASGTQHAQGDDSCSVSSEETEVQVSEKEDN